MTAELRTARVLTGVVALAAVLGAAGTALADRAAAGPAIDTWDGWLPGLAVAAPVVAGAAAPWVSYRMLRWLAGAIALGHGLLLAGAVVAGALRPGGGELPWFLTVLAVPAGAAVIAWGRVAAWSVLVADAGLVQAARLLSPGDPATAIANDVFTTFGSALLVLLFGVLLDASRDLDRSAAIARDRAARRAAVDARDRVRERMRALVHDEVLALLLLGARDDPALRAAVATEARRVRTAIGELRTGDETAAVPLGLDAFLAALRDDVVAVAPDAELVRARGPRSASEPAEVPGDVVAAIRGAVRQALVNSVQHAREASRRVEVRVDGGGIRVVVRDDGPGFDPAAVPPTRLGIASSIVGRLAAVPGGRARVDSRPGAGTTVVVEWAPPAPPARDPVPLAVLGPGTRGLRSGAAAVVVVFLAAQAVLAVLAAGRTGTWWLHGIAFAGVAAGLLGIGWGRLAVPARWRAWMVAVVAIAVAALGVVPAVRDPAVYGDLWFVVAAGFVLVALAVRGRPGIAAAAGGLALAIVAVGAAVQRNDLADVLAASSRCVALLAVGLGLVLAISRVRRRDIRMRQREVDAAAASASRDAASAEFESRVRSLEDAAGPLVDLLAEGRALTPAERQDCLAAEGRLRDQYRGGRLATPEVVAAATAARRRGVDVVLLDDGARRELDDEELARVAAWAAERIAATATGRVTARILPGDRSAVASVVAGDEVHEYPGSARAG